MQESSTKKMQVDRRGLNVPAHFALQASETPFALAVVDDTTSLTYAELERRSDILARHLRLLGIGRDAVVGL